MDPLPRWRSSVWRERRPDGWRAGRRPARDGRSLVIDGVTSSYSLPSWVRESRARSGHPYSWSMSWAAPRSADGRPTRVNGPSRRGSSTATRPHTETRPAPRSLINTDPFDKLVRIYKGYTLSSISSRCSRLPAASCGGNVDAARHRAQRLRAPNPLRRAPTAFRYDRYDTTGEVAEPGSYAFLADPADTTSAVTTYEALRDGTTTALLIHKSDAHGASQAALYDAVEAGDTLRVARGRRLLRALQGDRGQARPGAAPCLASCSPSSG